MKTPSLFDIDNNILRENISENLIIIICTVFHAFFETFELWEMYNSISKMFYVNIDVKVYRETILFCSFILFFICF